MGKINIIKKLSFTIVILLSSFLFIHIVNSQAELTSPTYKIVDPTVDSGGGRSESTSYSMLSSQGGALDDARLLSASYRIGSGFPNGIQANVPIFRCAESSTDSGSTNCINFPNANGAQGECGIPGCYDRFKVEINPSGNPIDTLYLVAIYNEDTNTQYFLQSDHTLDTTYDINDYMTICELEGKDTRTGSGCETGGDPNWDLSLQSSNVLNANANTNYTVKARALHGDFTESDWGSEAALTTESPTLVFDIDIGTTSAADTDGPYNISFGNLTAGVVNTPANQIWLDLGTNMQNGMTTYVKDLYTGLYNGTDTIPSQSEDLSVDAGSDGGFGLQIGSVAEDALGPLLEGTTYDLATNNIGTVTTSDTEIFSTDTLSTNVGPITNGRGGIILKALAVITTPGGVYTDTLTFTMIGNP
ncbi:MAG: hypothetical protein Q9M91_00350 [Candidatus Dojkabacteria bacterium]|nr:hypothetical protein [Candidatus Dojkabacteria bacterium]MDQ7020282.1 hypothetical protein [Candidatus Dojkabacteria bacterium]